MWVCVWGGGWLCRDSSTLISLAFCFLRARQKLNTISCHIYNTVTSYLIYSVIRQFTLNTKLLFNSLFQTTDKSTASREIIHLFTSFGKKKLTGIPYSPVKWRDYRAKVDKILFILAIIYTRST